MFQQEKIWKSTHLPSLPSVAVKLLELVGDPETEIHQIVDLIKTDPAITVQILKASNSTFFGFKSEVTTIERAVPLLGTTVVTSLALSFSLANDSISGGELQSHYQTYWKQSVIHAAAGEILGKRCHDGLECEYFLAGLMLDIGRLAMLKAVPEEYLPVLKANAEREQPLHEIEQELLNLNHAEVSYRLMKDWGLPVRMLNGVRLQHKGTEILKQILDPDEQQMEASCALANAIGDYFVTNCNGMALKRIQDLAEHFFKMSESEVEDLLKAVRTRIEDAGELFSVDMSDIGDVSDLMAEANRQLFEFTMRAQTETKLATERQRQIEEEKKLLQSKNSELQQKAIRDALTGIYNRSYFEEEYANTIQNAKDRSCCVAVILADIDKFKSVNDTYGHQFGDEVLKWFAKLMSNNLRNTDILCRYGGEEFIIIVSQPSENGVQKLTERLRSSVENGEVCFEGARVPVTSSFGTAILMPGRGQGNCAELLIAEADEALYASKHYGRNQAHHRNLLSEADQNLIKHVNQLKFSRWLVSKEILDIAAISRLLLKVKQDERKLGTIAINIGMLTENQVDQILQTQEEQPHRRFGDLGVEMGLLTNEQLHLLLSWQLEPPSSVVQSLIRSGVFSEERCQKLLAEYKWSIDSILPQAMSS